MDAYQQVKLIRNILWDRYKIPYITDDNEITGFLSTDITMIIRHYDRSFYNHIICSTGLLGYNSDKVELYAITSKGLPSMIQTYTNYQDAVKVIIESYFLSFLDIFDFVDTSLLRTIEDQETVYTNILQKMQKEKTLHFY